MPPEKGAFITLPFDPQPGHEQILKTRLVADSHA